MSHSPKNKVVVTLDGGHMLIVIDGIVFASHKAALEYKNGKK